MTDDWKRRKKMNYHIQYLPEDGWRDNWPKL